MGKIHIVSSAGEPFRDRAHAGQILSQKLSELGYKGGVVLGIPCGGIVVAQEIANRLNAELDIVIAHKIGAPGNPEFAIGAVSENGQLFFDENLASRVGASNTYIQQECARQLSEIKRHQELIRSAVPKISLAGQVVIVTDDGIATGATMQAALWAVRQENPEKLIAALPVGPENSPPKLTNYADEVICLQVPPYFDAVGRFYLEFDQIEDQEVLEILKNYRKTRDEQ